MTSGGPGIGTSGPNVAGLRRFAKRTAATPPPPAPQAIAPAAGDRRELNGLAGLVAGLPALDSVPGLAGDRRQDDAGTEHCELCREVLTDRHELSLPPKLTYGEIKGFTLYATRTVLSGGGEELFELAKTNLRELEVE